MKIESPDGKWYVEIVMEKVGNIVVISSVNQEGKNKLPIVTIKLDDFKDIQISKVQ